MFWPVTNLVVCFQIRGMDVQSGAPFGQGDSTKQQERHYYLLSELQTLVKDLPR